MPVASTRVTDEFYERVKDVASEMDMSVSDFIRQSMEQAVDRYCNPEHVRSKNVDPVSEKVVAVLDAEVGQKNEQIAQLHHLLAMAQTHAGDLTGHLGRTYAQLSDGFESSMPHRDHAQPQKRWWHFW